MTKDSGPETLAHIEEVATRLRNVADAFFARATAHDASKLGAFEKPYFDAAIEELEGLTYGSPEYRAALDRIRPALEHHYGVNTHHPEHYPNGVDGMCLLDLVEMYCDWAAAVLRHNDGNMEASLAHNRVRFAMSDQLASIFSNTLARHGGFCGYRHLGPGQKEPMKNQRMSNRYPKTEPQS